MWPKFFEVVLSLSSIYIEQFNIRNPYLTVLGQTAPGKGIVFAVDGSEGV
jgi:hypothetical protein